MSLVGKFFLHSGADYYQTGEIIERAEPGYVLLKFDSTSDAPPHIKLFCVDALSTDMPDEGYPNIDWQFFTSRKELTEYVKWMETPSPKKVSAKVVKLHDR